MRRVFAISLAILIVMGATRGVMAQDSKQDGNDLLLKILKEKNILTDAQFQEIKGQLALQRNETEQKLTALDRSVADYLAKAGDTVGGNDTYVKNQGVTFSSGDGMWSVYFGGLIQFYYTYGSGDTEDPHGGFGVANRLDFGGTIFDPNLTFYTQYQTSPIGQVYETSNNGNYVNLLDAYLNWKIADMAQVKVGHFKIPYGRQSLVDVSDLEFGWRNITYSRFRLGDQGRDTGFMLHNMVQDPNDPNGLAWEWAIGAWNGMMDGSLGNNFSNDTWLAWGLRAGVYPMGPIPYVEGDWTGSPDVKVGIAGSFYMDEHSAPGTNPKLTAWEIDGVATWNGLYATGEYFSQKVDNGSTDYTDTGWYLHGGYFLMPGQFEVLASYGMIDYDNNDKESEWALGGAWYFDGHEWKVVGSIGQTKYDPDHGSSDTNWFIDLMLQADW